MSILFERREPIEISAECSAKLATFSFFAAIMVVMIHARWFLCGDGMLQYVMRRLLSEGVTQVSVPFFFVVSGFLLAGRMSQTGWWWRSVKSRTVSLLLPYVIWDVLFTVGIFGILWLAQHHLVGSVRECLFASISCGMERWSHVPGLHELWVSADDPMWYVRSLFILVLISPVYSVLKFDRYGVLLGLLFVMLFTIVFLIAPTVPLLSKFVWTTLEWRGCLYFGIGIWLRYHPLNFSRMAYWGFGVLAVVIWFVGCSANAHWLSRYFWMPLAIGAIWGLVPAVSLSRSVSALSFPIFVIHDFFMWIAKGVLDYQHPAVWKYCLSVFLVVLISSLVARLVHRVFPYGAKILFGGR